MSIDAAIAAAVAGSLDALLEQFQAMRAALALNNAEPKAYTVKGAAQALGVGETTMRNMIASGHVRTVVLPGMTDLRVPAQALDDLINTALNTASPPTNVFPLHDDSGGGTAA